MTDIANIGFKADTSDLDKAVLTLNKLQNAAQGMSTTQNKVSQAVEGSSKKVSQAALAVATAQRAKAKAHLDSIKASGQASQADLKAAKTALDLARAEESKARSLMATAKANMAMEKATMSSTAAQQKQLMVMERINKITGVSRGRKSAEQSFNAFQDQDFGMNRDQMPNRFNTANIAAQFQDIGVTAAMGMNPLTVALQQGTQLSAILNSMESPLKGIAVAFRSIINPVSLMAIAFTAILVTLIQFVDWSMVAKNALTGLANVIDATAPYVLSLVAVLALIYSPAILGGIFAVTKSIVMLGSTALVAGSKAAAAWIIAGGPLAWFAAGITLVLSLLFVFREEIAKIVGTDVLGVIRSGVNNIIGFFIGGFNGIKEAWATLPAAIGDIMIKTANNILGTIERTIMEVVERINRLPGVQIDLDFDGEGNLQNKYAGKVAQAGMIIGQEIDKALSKDYIGSIGEAVGGITDKLRNAAAGIASGSDEEKNKKSEAEKQIEAYGDLINGANRRINTLKAEQAALGLTSQEAAKLRYESDLLNEAMQKGIILTPQQRSELEELAGTMARIETETAKAKDILEFARETTNGFVSDLRTGLLEGESLWDSFANAAVKAIDKILEKQFEMILNNAQSSGIFDSILGGIGSVLTGGSSGAEASFATASARGVSNPALFGPGFAKGGAFTNSIVSQTTPFAFANGGAFGVMGEAGPEAIMPLQRGSDGSLGVRMVGGNSGGGMTVVNEYNIDASGAEIGVEERIRAELEELRDNVPAIAVSSVQNANNRNLRFLE